MKHDASNYHNSRNCPFCCATRLMHIRNSDLLLDSLIIVEYLEGSRREFLIMSNEVEFAVKLHLHRHDILLDAVFAFRLGAQTETHYASAACINDERYVLASAQRFDFYCAASIDVQELKQIVVTLVWVASKRPLHHFFFLTHHEKRLMRSTLLAL